MGGFRNITSWDDLMAAKNDGLIKLLVKAKFNKLQGSTFDAVILGLNEGANIDSKQIGRFRFCRIRATDGSDDGLTTPFTFPRRILKNKLLKIINSHRIAIFDPAVEGASEKYPKSGEVWACRYMKAGFGGPIMLLKQASANHKGKVHYTDDPELVSVFNAGGGTSLGSAGPPNLDEEMSEWNESQLDMNFDQYQILSKGLKEALTFISSLESPVNGYKAANCGWAKGWESCEQTVKDQFGTINPAGALLLGERIPSAPLTEIIASQEKQHGALTAATATGGGVGLSAVGRYQIIEPTLKQIIAALKLDNQINDPANPLLFNESTQDAMATWLLLGPDKRPLIGGYLLDKHDNAEWAAHEMAREWSSWPSQWTYKERGKTINVGDTLHDIAGNKASITPLAARNQVIKWKAAFLAWVSTDTTKTGKKALDEG